MQESIYTYGKVAVLMGGPSAAREISLKSGAAVLNALRKENDRVNSIQRKEQLDMKKQRKQEEWENTAVYR